jgi:hypothetical protein
LNGDSFHDHGYSRFYLNLVSSDVDHLD